MPYITDSIKEYVQQQLWGYSCTKPDIDRYTTLLGIYRREELRKAHGEGCLDDCTTLKLVESIRKVSPDIDVDGEFNFGEDTFNIDDSNYNEYIENGGCEVLDDFEKWLESLVCDVEVPEFSIRAKDILCKIDLDLHQKEVSCELLTKAKAVQQACKMEVKSKRKEL